MPAKSKKGAIELSMNTIIIVIIGIAMLGLGILFVTKIKDVILPGVADIGVALNKQIDEQFKQGGILFLTANKLEIKKDKSETLAIAFINDDINDCTFSYAPLLVSGTSKYGTEITDELNWISPAEFSKEVKANGGKLRQMIIIKVPKNAASGDYIFEFNVEDSDCIGISYETNPQILVTVAE